MNICRFFLTNNLFFTWKKTSQNDMTLGSWLTRITSTLTMDKGGSQKMIMFFTWKKCQREGQLKHHGDPSHLQRRSSFGLVRSSPDSQNHCWLFAASFARIFGSFITVVGRHFRWMGAFCPLRCRGGHFPILKGTVSLRISFFFDTGSLLSSTRTGKGMLSRLYYLHPYIYNQKVPAAGNGLTLSF